MVSWLRSFELHWKHLETIFDPEEAVDLQLSFQEIRKSPDPKESFRAWVKRAEHMPGAILLPRGGTKKGGGGPLSGRVVPSFKVTTIHHLKPFNTGDDGGSVVCLESLRVFAKTVTVSVDELLSGLVSDIKASTKSVREKNIPPVAKFLELKTEDIKKNYKPDAEDNCIKADALADWPCGVYVPFPLLSMIFNGEEDADVESQARDLDDPLEMIENLLDEMGDLAREDPGGFEAWKGSAVAVGMFLWAIANEINQGVSTNDAPGSGEEVRFTLKCNQEILFTEEEVKGRVTALFNKPAPGDLQGGPEEQGREEDGASEDSLVKGLALGDKKRKPQRDQLQPRDDPEIQDSKRLREAAALPPPPEPVPVPQPQGQPNRSSDENSFLLLRDIIQGMATSNMAFLEGMTASNRLIAESNQASTRALLAQGAALKELTLANKESIDSKEAKRKATSNWLPADVFLLKALSAELGWLTEGVPTVTPFAESLFDKKNIIKATNLVRETGVKDYWCGGILKSGLTEFIGGGFVSGDIDAGPTGFSVLYCFASSYTETDSTDFRKQQVKDAFGESKGLTDEMVTAFEKQHIFVPDDTYKALEQLDVAIAFLKAVCGRDTIATEGYSTGRMILRGHKKKFDDWAKSDLQFLLKYLLFLDRIFYLFCKELQEFEFSPDPLLDAKADLDGWMVRNVQKGILPNIRMGVKPEFGVPRNLQGRTATKDGILDLKAASTPNKNKAKGAGGSGAVGGGPAGNAASGGADVGGAAGPEWQRTMPAGEYVPEWQIPPGKRFGDFFGSHLTENNKIFPRHAHHKTKRPSSICARYQIELARGCRFGADCSLTHVRPKDIPVAARDKITSEIKVLFATGGAKN
jgi:hypothetical protein